ncbi:uncharacterized protein LOC118231076 isoform X1 [Anguilla anguilla]|uniref:uncharacterized protein LOC118231076 isoform X1 n=1 Tax=Anguilla anguilla TaxID=7936 RepID=UPI0015AA5361|nr:uncharacterized protein LOC118231076 isoform X1 [Anguilla anguilla]
MSVIQKTVYSYKDFQRKIFWSNGVSPEDREPRLCGNSRWMKPGDSDPSAPFPTGESSARDCEVEGVDGVDMSRVCVCSQGKECVYEQGWCLHCCGPHSLREECLLSDPQGDSDADADIEDTDNRLQGGSPLQRMSSRRRRRQRLARPDTTESEDDGGRSHRAHRWSLRLSPHRTHNRTILEVLLHTYYTSITNLLHIYYTPITNLLHRYYTPTINPLHTYYTPLTNLLHTYSTPITNLLHTYYTPTLSLSLSLRKVYLR